MQYARIFLISLYLLTMPLLASAYCEQYTVGSAEYSTCYYTCMMNPSDPACGGSPSVGCTSYSDWDNTQCGGSFCSSGSGYMDSTNCPTEYQNYMCMMNPQSSPSCPGYTPQVGCTSYSDWDNTQCGGSFCSSGSGYMDSTNCPTEYQNYMCMMNPQSSPSCSGYNSCDNYATWDTNVCGSYCSSNTGRDDYTNCHTEYCTYYRDSDLTNCLTEHCAAQPSSPYCDTTSACTFNDWDPADCGGAVSYCSSSHGNSDSTNCPNEYFNYQCSVDHQYSPNCPGYEAVSSACTYNDWVPELCGSSSYCVKHMYDDPGQCWTTIVSDCSSASNWRAEQCGAHSFCEAYPGNAACIQTSACTYNDWNSNECGASSYCVKHMYDDPGQCWTTIVSDCSSASNWRAEQCGAKSFCTAHPADPSCVKTCPCSDHCWSPEQCGASTYEEAHTGL